MIAVLHGLLSSMRATAAWSTVLNGLLAVVVLFVTMDASVLFEVKSLEVSAARPD